MLFFMVLAVVACQRLFEGWLTLRHSRWMRERGGREYGREHYPWMVALHGLFVTSLLLEYLWRPSRLYLLCLLPLLAAQLLRYSAMWALGTSWNTRVWVLPGAARVRHGIYRWMRHPNYAGVILEFFFLPAMFGLWITASLFGALNLWMLRARISVEERALRLGDL